MGSCSWKTECICLVISFLTSRIFCQDILGCGGFVKSDIDINFSEVEVKLYTKQGSLKDHTDCAPNNGYYFLPLYDKGEYVLKIEPPDGWSFEPTQVNLNVDGVTDMCSLGKDINFEFKGFAITGKVVSAGSQTGPKGVKVTLSQNSELKPVSETFTLDGGSFKFTPVLPGQYVIKASHHKWQLNKDTVTVQVTKGNAVVPDNSLVVAGYDVSGSVTADNEPIKGVSFILFKSDGLLQDVQNCSKTPLPGFKASGTPLCHVNSNEQGRFTFPCLPPGKYKVIPHYEGPQSIKFDVHPTHVEFTVTYDSLKINTEFQVKGFSVSGRVLLRPSGKGIEGASVLMDNKIVDQTKADGTYHLENMQAGTYLLQVQARDMLFNDVTVKITPNTPQLSDVYPSSFRVCGRVASHQLTPGVAEKGPRQVEIATHGSASHHVAETKAETGEFCLFLQPGKYEVKVKVTHSEMNKGLQFYPNIHEIQVTDSPILSGIDFAQLKVRLTGKIICLSPEKCDEIPVVLKAVPSGQNEPQVFVAKIISSGGSYSFDSILPGRYRISVDKDGWCWETSHHTVHITSAEALVPDFVQTGFSVTFVSSHETQVQYKQQTAPDQPIVTGSHTVKKGITKSCVSAPGSYEFTAVGCHGYSQPSVRWNSAVVPLTTVQLTAISHTMGGKVLSSDKVDDLYVNVIKNEDGKLKAKLGPLKSEVGPDGRFSYNFKLMVLEGERLTLEPSASILLFTPLRASLVGATDCVEVAATFSAERGKVIEGQVIPPLAGVKIVISEQGKQEPVIITETDRDGKYKVGPLQGGIQYSVVAEKEGYVLTKADPNGVFSAHKLAEVIVEVLDKADGKPLQGVLLSLSGGESFRRNSQTGSDGKMTFSSLSPGEYFLKPMMKEYRFEPQSKMITVKEGATAAIQLNGYRVAYSAYGTVTSLSGEPEEGVVVEAVGLGKCSHFQEESSTEASGQFRVRGLQPQCEYTVRMKKGQDVNQHIDRATPEGVTVKAVDGDVVGLKMIVFHPPTQMDLSAHIQAMTPEHLRTLRAKLCREDVPDSPIHVIKLDTYAGKPPTRGNNAALVMFPSVPLDGRGYFLQLESSLSHSTYTYSTHAIHFKANSSFKLVKLSFKPEQRTMEQDVVQTPYLILPVVLIGLLVYWNQEKILPVLNRFAQTLNNTVSTGVTGKVSNSNSEHSMNDAVMVEPVTNIAKRKLKPRKT